MAGLIGARLAEDLQPWPVAGLVAGTREILRESVARLDQLRRLATQDARAHQRGRRLTQRAGLHLLAQTRPPPPIVQGDVYRHPPSAPRPSFLCAPPRSPPPPPMPARTGPPQSV